MSSRSFTHFNLLVVLSLLTNLIPTPRAAQAIAGPAPPTTLVATSAAVPAWFSAVPDSDLAARGERARLWLPPARVIPAIDARAEETVRAAPQPAAQQASRQAALAQNGPWPPPAYTSFVWAGTQNAGVWYWDEEGWHPRHTDVLSGNVKIEDIAVSPFDHNVVLASTSENGVSHVYITTAHKSWVSVTLPFTNALWHRFHWDTYYPGIVFAVGARDEITAVWARSTDNGRTWVAEELEDLFGEDDLKGANDIWGAGNRWYIASSNDPPTLFTCNRARRYWRSLDGGTTWEARLVDSDWCWTVEKWVAGRVDHPKVVLIAPYGHNGILGPEPTFRSYDGGNAWAEGAGIKYPRYPEYDRTRPGTLWVALQFSTGGVARSSDDGLSFTKVYTGGKIALAVDGYTGRVYAGAGNLDRGEMIYSDDGGTTWFTKTITLQLDTEITALSAPQPPYLPDWMVWNQECPFCTAYDARHHAGDPLDTHSGNFTHNQPGFGLPTQGGRLDFRLTYISQATEQYTTTPSAGSGPGLGYGWTHNQAMTLTFPYGISGPVVLQGHGGSRLAFGNNGDPLAGSGQTFSPIPGLRAELTRLGQAGAYTYVITATTQDVYTFDDGGRLLNIQDPQGSLTTYEHGDGRLSRVIGPSGDPSAGSGQSLIQQRLLTFDYDDQNRLIRVSGLLSGSSALSYSVGLGYDDYDDLLVFTDTRGMAWTYAYSGATHLLTHITNPNGERVVENVYDERGRVVEQIDPLSHSLRLRYTLSNTTAITDALNRVTVDRYDGRGTWAGSVYTGSRAITRAYDVNLNLGFSADPLGNETSYDWSAGGYDLEQVTDAQDRTTSFGYDARHNLTRTVNARGHTTSYGYDEHNNLITISDALSGTVANTFDDYGNLLSTTDPRGQTTGYAYDAFGQRAAITDALGFVTRFGYDPLGRLITTTQVASDGQRVLMVRVNAYDGGDNLIRVTENYTPGKPQNYQGLWNLTTEYCYDGVGNQTVMTGTAGRVRLTAYDAANRVVSTTVNYTTMPGADPSTYNMVTRYGYDAAGNQVAVTDTLNHVNRTFYDELNRPFQTVVNYVDGTYEPDEPDEDVLTTYSYDAAGNLITTTDTLGRVTLNGYDELNRLVTATVNYTTTPGADPSTCNLTTIYGYNEVGNVVTSMDHASRFTFHEYDALNRLVKTTSNYTPTQGQNYQDQYNLVTAYGYDQAGNRVAVTDTLGRVTRYEYDELGRLVTTADALSGMTWVEYNDLGRRWKSHACAELDENDDCALWHTTVYTYDAAGRLAAIEDAAGGITHYCYDALGNTLVMTDAEDNATHYAYDALNRVVTTTNALSGTTVVEYDALGRRLRVTNPESQITNFAYDGLGRTVVVTDALGYVTRYEYDGLGNRITVIDPLTHTTVYTFDSVNRLVATENAAGGVTRYAYDALGNRTAITDAEGIVTRYEYDAASRLAAVVENWQMGQWANEQINVRTEYGYDALGHRTHVTDALTHTSVYTYDALGRLIAESDPLAHTTRYIYDVLGNRVVMTQALGTDDETVAHYTYDDVGRLMETGYSDATTATYRYDAAGNRSAMTDTLGTTTYTYDALYRLEVVKDPYDEVVRYSYDALGNRTGLTYPDQRTLTYTYSALNQLTRVEDWDGGLTRYGYDDAGRLVTATLPNGVQATYGYDDANRLTLLEHRNSESELLARYVYDLDEVGNRVMVTETVLMPVSGQGSASLRESGQWLVQGGMSAGEVAEVVLGRAPGLGRMARDEWRRANYNSQPPAAAPDGLQTRRLDSGLVQSRTQYDSVGLALRTDRKDLPADGESLAYLAVFAYAEDGEPLPDGTPVSWETGQGSLVDGTTETQLGLAWAALRADGTPGLAVVTATIGKSVSGRISVEIVAPEAAVYRLDESDEQRDGPEAALALARNTVRADQRGDWFVDGPYHRLDFTTLGLNFSGVLSNGKQIALNYRLSAVRLGEREWLRRGDVAPQVKGNVARYGLGQGVSEEYIALDAGLEQRFVFTEPPVSPAEPPVVSPAEPLPADGADMTIVGAFETDLTPRLNLSRTVVSFYRRGDKEWLARYGPALAYDAAGHLALLELRLDRKNNIEIVLPGDWLARATYPVVVDPLIGSRLTIGSGGNLGSVYAPDVAYNSDDDQYLVTWLWAGTEVDAIRVQARRVSGQGQVEKQVLTLYQYGGEVSQWEAPRTTYDPTSDQYLVVWAVNPGTATPRLYSRQVPTSSTTLGALQVVHSSGDHANPSVAADTVDGGYLVAWDTTQNVYARRVTSGGVPTGTVINVAGGVAVEQDQDPDVAFGGAAEEYLVAWERGSDVYARRVLNDGTLPGSAFAVVTATGSQVDPALAYGPESDAFLVTWSSSNDVYGRRVASGEQLLGEVIDVAVGTNTQIAPDVGYNALTGDWLAVWRSSLFIGWPGPWGQVVHRNGALSGNNQRFWNQGAGSRVATSGAGSPTGYHLVVWDRGDNLLIYGQRFRPLDAGFIATPTQGLAPLTTQFSDTSTPAGVADEWHWSFGDGGAGTAQHPTYTYTQPGPYSVTQRITDTASGEWDVLTHTHYVSVASPLVTRIITYTYDGLYRLVEADYRSTGLAAGSSGEQFAYRYDAVGNRTAYTATITQTTVTTYTYDAANRLVNAGGVDYTWDNRGNLLDDGAYEYTWNAAGRLVTVTDGITTLGFLYDGDGNRLARSVNGTLTTHTLDLGLGLPEVLVEHDGADVTHYLHLPHGVATDDGAAWSYSTADGLGSVRQRLDASGQVVVVNGYQPFGSPLAGEGGAPHGFTGEWWERDAGLLFLRARYMQPGTGRFVSRDPWGGFAGFPRSQNGYGYVQNNPIGWVDPSGYIGSPLGCNSPECYIFYFPGTEKINNQYLGWGHGESLFISKLKNLSTALFVVFPFGAGSGYTPEQIRDLESRSGQGGACGELLGTRGKVQEQQVLDIWHGTADGLSGIKADEVAAKLHLCGVYADSPYLEIDFVAHSGGSHYAVGAAQSLRRHGFHVDNVVTLGGLFKVNDFRTHGLDNIGHLYDNISEDPRELVPYLRGPFCTGFDAYHGNRAFRRDRHPHLWELDDVTKIDAGKSHSSYFSDAGVWIHLSTKTVGLCRLVRLHRLLRDGWSELKNW